MPYDPTTGRWMDPAQMDPTNPSGGAGAYQQAQGGGNPPGAMAGFGNSMSQTAYGNAASAMGGLSRPPNPASLPPAPTYAPNPGSGPAMPGATTTNPLGNWQNPQLAVGAALQQMGISPASNHPFVRDLMSRANDIVQSLIPQIGQQQLENGSQGAAAAIMAQVKRALTGGQVFATGDQRTQNAGLLQSLGQMGQSLAGDINPATGVLRTIASMVNDPNASVNLLQSILNGGAAPEARSVLGRSLSAVPLNFATQSYNNPSAFVGPDGRLINILDLILNGTLTGGAQGAATSSFLPSATGLGG